MPVRVVTDSSSNVPDDYLGRLGILEVPAIVNFGGQSYRNKVDLSSEDFYRRLAAAPDLPTTAQPSPQQFADAYARLAAEGASEVIAVTVSGRVSGTLDSAVGGAEHAPIVIHTWDTESASVGSGWQAIAAAEMAQAGLGGAAILARLHGIRSRMQTAASPAALRNLVASGRVPKLRGNLAELLNVKPILSMIEGRLEPVGQVRGRKRALTAMLDRIATGVGGRPVRAAVAHANIPNEAAEFAEEARGRLNTAEMFVTDIGPALATLGGPGIIILAAFVEEEL